MTKQRNSRIGPYLIAAVLLLGASAIRVSVAEEPRSSLRGAEQLRQFKGVRLSTAPKNLPKHREPVPGAADRLARNAIGAIVARHEGIKARSGNLWVGRLTVPFQGATPAGVARSAPSGLATPDDRTGRQNALRPVSELPVSSAAPNRRAIDGTGMVHLGFGRSTVGGPAKTLTGINGSTIRPKH